MLSQDLGCRMADDLIPPSTAADHLGEEVAGVSDRDRFIAELEFVQCLASPQYINCEF